MRTDPPVDPSQPPCHIVKSPLTLILPRQHLALKSDHRARHRVSSSAVDNLEDARDARLHRLWRLVSVPPIPRRLFSHARLDPARVQGHGHQARLLILKMKSTGDPIQGRLAGAVRAPGQLLKRDAADRGRHHDDLGARRPLQQRPQPLEYHQGRNGIDLERGAEVVRRRLHRRDHGARHAGIVDEHVDTIVAQVGDGLAYLLGRGGAGQVERDHVQAASVSCPSRSGNLLPEVSGGLVVSNGGNDAGGRTGQERLD